MVRILRQRARPRAKALTVVVPERVIAIPAAAPIFGVKPGTAWPEHSRNTLATRRIMAPTRILLVDDEISVLDLIRTTLETCGHAIDTAASSHEAMEKVRSEEYDMIILDL